MANVDNSLVLALHRSTTSDERTNIRVTAIFVQAKLVEAGMSAAEAKVAVEKIYNDGRDQGWAEGNESGYDAGYDAADVARPDEFSK